MKKIAIILSLVSLLSCNKKEEMTVDYALFSGKIINKQSDKVIVYGQDFKKVLTVKEDGTFSDTLRIPRNGKYNFAISPEQSSFHLEKGDQINLTIDTKKFDESIVYTGKSSDKNNYLATSYLMKETFRDNYKLPPNEFKSKAKKQLEALNTNLKEVENETFKTFAETDNKYSYLSQINEYQGLHSRLNGLDELVELPNDFLNELKNITLDNEENFKNFDGFKNIVMSTIFKQASQIQTEDSSKAIPFIILELAKEFKSQTIKNELVESISFYLNADSKNIESLYATIMEISTDDELKKELSAKYNNILKLKKGAVSPVFVDYENYDGNKTSLKDFKGKYVYIDLWATWCKPCIGEIPFLQALEKDYHKKKIAFVSISVDKLEAHDAWKEMVAKKELTGVQLFANKSFKSDFIKAYAVNFIPRFILIDPEGKIVDSNAPRPSSPGIKKVLESLSI